MQLKPRYTEPQWMCETLGGKVVPGETREFGFTPVTVQEQDALLRGVSARTGADEPRRPRRGAAAGIPPHGAHGDCPEAAIGDDNHVCPLTPLAEDLGAARGSVVDIFLLAWVASLISIVAGSAALLALILNLRALRARPGKSKPQLRRGALVRLAAGTGCSGGDRVRGGVRAVRPPPACRRGDHRRDPRRPGVGDHAVEAVVVPRADEPEERGHQCVGQMLVHDPDSKSQACGEEEEQHHQRAHCGAEAREQA